MVYTSPSVSFTAMRKTPVLLCIALLLSACGQTGSLYLPDEGAPKRNAKSPPVKLVSPPASQAEPQSEQQPASQAEEEQPTPAAAEPAPSLPPADAAGSPAPAPDTESESPTP